MKMKTRVNVSKNTNIKQMPKGHVFKNLKLVLKDLWKFASYKLIIVVICLVLSAVSQTTAAIFLAQIINNVIDPAVKQGVTFAEFSSVLTKYILIMASIYTVGLIANITYTQMVAVIVQKFLNHLRKEAFNKMEKLPIKYFDTHTHGDVMSIYTNDIDAIRELTSSSLIALISSGSIILALIFIMMSYSIYLALIVFVGAFFMVFVSKTYGGRASKYFVKQQRAIGNLEGFVEESMNGMKVIKVFCHEEEIINDFDQKNDYLKKCSTSANTNGNILGPVVGNIGNILYAIIAVLGVYLVLSDVSNLTLMGIVPFEIGYVVSFLGMARQFSRNVNQISMQTNSIVMGLAGASRVYELLDEKEEDDEGNITLVNAEMVEGELVESEEKTGIWAWKKIVDGKPIYRKLAGDIRMHEVDFGYSEDKIVLHNINLYAEPGQRVAFVGATGAGKTTITNLINRFYDISRGKITYDGIDISEIKKHDLRRSLGIVLQDTNLFTGTVRDNIRYGKLDATDEEIYQAAKTANAYDFIMRLPNGFDTMLTSDGANLSQGQRQLLSIARAAVADAPVMIMDEATSSIDTRTEALVQEGTDKLMNGRTVFFIAHRLSTVKKCDVIMVLEQGVIIERGNHEELIEKKGKYYQLYTGAFELD